jgi:GNAT acetyltransferase-like protein
MNIVDSPDFGHLPEQALQLFAGAAESSFFNLPEWYGILAGHGLDPGWRVRLYLRDGAGLIASVHGDAPRDIRSCCTPYTTEHAILHRDTDWREPVQALAAELPGAGPTADAIRLSGLDPEHGSFQALIQGFKSAGFAVNPYLAWVNRFEPLGDGGFAPYLAARPSELKNTAKRKLSALQKAKRIQFRTHHDSEIENFISDYEDVYSRSWKMAEPYSGFMPALIRLAAAKKALRFGILSADSEPIAAQFWIVWGRRATLYKLAYAEKWRSYSPGTLLTMHMIRDVIERDRPSELDFGRGDDNYKKLWMPARRERWGIEAANPKTVRGLVLAARMKAGALKRRLFGHR